MKTTTIVNEAKRTCVYIIEDAAFAADARLIRALRNILPQRVSNQLTYLQPPISNRYIGKAKCNPLDVFDADVGVRIARQRAHDKLNRAIARTLANTSARLEYCAGRLDAEVDEYCE
jgi:hypothetical protein